jgi:hypothetical protein
MPGIHHVMARALKDIFCRYQTQNGKQVFRKAGWDTHGLPVELGRIDLMQKFSFFEVEDKEAGNVIKALNRANWNGRKVSVEIAGEEGKDAPKGKRRNEGGNYGKKEFDGKKRSYKDERRSEVAGKRSDKTEYAATDKKKNKPTIFRRNIIQSIILCLNTSLCIGLGIRGQQ